MQRNLTQSTVQLEARFRSFQPAKGCSLTPKRAIAAVTVLISLVQVVGCHSDRSATRIPPYVFLDHLADADRSPNDAARIHAGEVAIRTGDDKMRGVFAHASSEVVFHAVPVPPRAHLRFAIGIEEGGWQQGGDGAIFMVSVRTDRGEEVVFSRRLEPQTLSADRGWIWADVDLDRYSTQNLDFVFRTDPGGIGREDYDWCWWANPVLEQTATEEAATPVPTAQPPYVFLDHLADAGRSPNDPQRIGPGEIGIRTGDTPVRAIFAQTNSEVVFHAVPVPAHGHLLFGIGIDERGWQQGGDGALFRVSVRTRTGEDLIFSRHLRPQTASADRGWIWADVDVQRYGGESVDFVFQTDKGETEDYDWCWWANPVLEECAACGISSRSPVGR